MVSNLNKCNKALATQSFYIYSTNRRKSKNNNMMIFKFFQTANNNKYLTN